eukprot:jgi/Botrbrau1/10535/Bobra.7_1s0015.1
MEGHFNSLTEFEMMTEALLGQQKPKSQAPDDEEAPPPPHPQPSGASQQVQTKPSHPQEGPQPALQHQGPGPPSFPTFAVRPATGTGEGSAPEGTTTAFWYPAVLPAAGPPLERSEAEWTEEAAAAVVRLTAPTVLNERNVSQNMGIPVGAIITPVPDMERPPPRVARRPICCTHCGAAANLYCKVDLREGAWECLFCGWPGQLPLDLDPTGWPEFVAEVVDYREGGTDEQPVVRALVIDITPDTDILERLKRTLLEVVSALPDDMEIAVITCDSAVRVYNLGLAGEATSADMLPGHLGPSPALLGRLKQGSKRHVAPLSACRSIVANIISSLLPSGMEGPGGTGTRGRPRCLGAALLTALEVVTWGTRSPGTAPEQAPDGQTMDRKGTHCNAAQIVLITLGPITVGPGAVPLAVIDGSGAPEDAYSERTATKFLEEASTRAVADGTSVDVFGVGPSAVNAVLLSRLAQVSGGAVVLQEEIRPLLAANLLAAMVRRVGAHGIVDFYTRGGLEVVQILGPVMSLDRGPGGPVVLGTANRPAYSPNACQMPSVERGQALGLALELPRASEDDYLHLQVALGWTGAGGRAEQRVVTRRLRLTKTEAAFLKDLDVEAASMLLARATIVGAQRRGAAADRSVRLGLRKSVGKHLTHVASRLGQPLHAEGGWFSRRKPLWKLPWELRFFAEALYQLQRGPLLGETGIHGDERAALYATFLSAVPEVDLRLLVPCLHVLNPATRRFELAAPADLALFSNGAAVLDTGNHLCIWLGGELPESTSPEAEPLSPPGMQQWDRENVRAACYDLAARLSAGRFPVPDIRCVSEGTPDARYITSRLFPLHRDSGEEQMSQLPSLMTLPEGTRLERATSLPHNEEPSFLIWCRSLSVEPSIAVDNVTLALEHLNVEHSPDVPPGRPDYKS